MHRGTNRFDVISGTRWARICLLYTSPVAIKAAETSAAGKSIYAYDKGSKVAQAYADFSKEAVSYTHLDVYKRQGWSSQEVMDKLFRSDQRPCTPDGGTSGAMRTRGLKDCLLYTSRCV